MTHILTLSNGIGEHETHGQYCTMMARETFISLGLLFVLLACAGDALHNLQRVASSMGAPAWRNKSQKMADRCWHKKC
jgi:hypothetical protein